MLRLLVCVPLLACQEALTQEIPKERSEGSWITFLSHRSGRNLLYRMRPDGSEVKPIFGGDLGDMPGIPEGAILYREPHWARQSPDGLLFLDWARDVVLPMGKYAPSRFMIHLGRTDGGPTRVIAPDGGEVLAWAPDSKRFAYSRYWILPNSLSGMSRRTAIQIVTVGIDGTDEKVVLEKPYPESWMAFDWSPDGRRLLLLQTTTIDLARAKYRLYELDLAAAEAKRNEKPGLTGDADDNQLELSKLKSLNPEPNTRILDARYAPDGGSIACMVSRFQVGPDGEFDGDLYKKSTELAILDVAAGSLRTILTNPKGIRGPICWSPDGEEILFSLYLPEDDKREKDWDEPGSGGLSIWAVRPDGTGARFLTTGWSPDWR